MGVPHILTGGTDLAKWLKYKDITKLKKLFFDALSVRAVINEDDPQDVFDLISDFKEFSGYDNSGLVNGHLSYAQGVNFEKDGIKIFISFGGSVKNMGALFETKGYEGSKLLADFFNTSGWGFVLTRADVTMDFDGGKPLFSDVKDKLIRYADQKNIKEITTQGDWIREILGRTLYVGARNSEYRFRLYEKSEEQWANKNASFPSDIVRLEWQYRPKRKKKYITRLEPSYVLSFCKNASEFFESVGATAIEPTSIPKVEPKEDMEIFYHMLKQYRKTLNRMIYFYGPVFLIRKAVKYLRTGEGEVQT